MVKRGADVVAASVLLVLLAPVVAVAASISTVSYRRWPFFTQPRVGRGGRPFRVIKVRTLDPATPTSLPKAGLEAHRPNAACRFLRAKHFDELPQLLNVLAGSMSLVGPRPEMVALQDRLPPAFAALRTQVRPGLTGLWQVSRAVEVMIADHPEYDEYYLRAQSLRLDLWILWRTAAGLLGRTPVGDLDEVPAWSVTVSEPSRAGIGDRPV